MLEISLITFSARLDTSRHALLLAFRGAAVVEDSLTGIHNAEKILLLSTGAAYTGVLGVPTCKNEED
jgi:hypothetical protein